MCTQQATILVQSGHSHSLTEEQLITITRDVFQCINETAPSIPLENVQSYYAALQASLNKTKETFWKPGQDHSIITFELYDNDKAHELILKLRSKVPKLGEKVGVRADIAALALFNHDASTVILLFSSLFSKIRLKILRKSSILQTTTALFFFQLEHNAGCCFRFRKGRWRRDAICARNSRYYARYDQ